MYRILDSLIKMLAPILAHTAEEAWSAMEHKSQDAETVHLTTMPKPDTAIDHKAEQPKWEKIMGLRDKVLQTLETLRQDKVIASNQEAAVTINFADKELAEIINELGADQFASLCIVSEVTVKQDASETTIEANKSPHSKCQRCWNYWPSVGKDEDHPDLCSRCINAISQP